MSVSGLTTQQLQQDLQNELTTANQLLRLISHELQQIKFFTSSGGEFEANIKQNASLVATLANSQQIDLENAPPIVRKQVNGTKQHLASEDQLTLRNDTEMDDT